MIEPTVGRSLYYFASRERLEDNDPMMALLCGVNRDGTINIALFDNHGNYLGGRTSVPLRQEGELIPEGGFAGWMPYQVGQARSSR